MSIRRIGFPFGAMNALSLHTAPVADPPAPAGGGGGGAPISDADKAIADKAASDAAAATAAADKVAADKAAADKVVADTKAAADAKAESLAAIKNVLKLPGGSTLDTALPERTAATLSELGLNPDTAQKAFEHLVKEAAAHADAQVAAVKKSHEPGGDAHKAMHEQFQKDLLAHPSFGAGKPEQFDTNRALVQRTVATVAKAAGLTPEELAGVEASGFLNHPVAARLFLAVGKTMKEDTLVPPAGGGTGDLTREEKLAKLYPSTAKKKD